MLKKFWPVAVMLAFAIAVPAQSLAEKETALKVALYRFRNAIDQYTADKKIPPATLKDLVDAGYLPSIPIDPVTGSNTKWQLIVGVSPLATRPDQIGILDVKSGSIDLASDGTPYNTW